MLDLRFFGGRGAASGVSDAGKRYGSEYTTLHSEGNIKFVRYNDSGSAKAPMETRTKGRIYVTVNADNALKNITVYDKSGKRSMQIDLKLPAHMIDGKAVLPHTHYGYIHAEKGTRRPTRDDKTLVEKVLNIWYNRKGR